MDTTSSFIIYEFDDTFILPTTGSDDILCAGSTNFCEIYKESQWILWRTSTGPTSPLTVTFQDAGDSTFRTPYEEKAGYKLSAYVIDELFWAEEHTFTDLPTFAKGTLGVTYAHRLSTLHKFTYDIWTLTITPEKSSGNVRRIDIHFPSQFAWLDTVCATSLSQTDENVNPVSCVSDCDQEVCSNLITIMNFLQDSAAATITVEIGAMSPSVAGLTVDFQVFYYSDETDTSSIVEDYTGGAITVLSIEYPIDYWVELPTASVYDRGIAKAAYGEI